MVTTWCRASDSRPLVTPAALLVGALFLLTPLPAVAEHPLGPVPGKPTLGTPSVTTTTASFTIGCVSPGKAPVTDYILWAEPGRIVQYHTPVPWPCSSVTATMTGLESGTDYTFKALARNLVGRYSEWSDAVSATTNALQVVGGGSSDPEPTDPLTASFEQVPSEHRGKGTFSFLVRLSETVGNFSKSPRPSSFEVTRGRVRSVEQVDAGLWRGVRLPRSRGRVNSCGLTS